MDGYENQHPIKSPSNVYGNKNEFKLDKGKMISDFAKNTFKLTEKEMAIYHKNMFPSDIDFEAVNKKKL